MYNFIVMYLLFVKEADNLHRYSNDEFFKEMFINPDTSMLLFCIGLINLQQISSDIFASNLRYIFSQYMVI